MPITANRNSTETAFAADDFSRQTNGSFRILIGKNLNACTAIEGQYNGFRDRQSSRTLTGAHDLSLPGALGMIDQGWGADFAHSSQMAVFSEMDFHSAELNLVRRSRCPSFVWLAGFRYFNFEEDFGLRSTPFIGAPHWYSDYAARTTNNLYGGQCGAKWDKLVTDRFGLQAVGKFGVYGNNAAQRSWIYEENPPAPGDVYRFADVKKTVTSLSGELNLGGYFKVAPNVSIVGGYNLMWIGDVARAADQLDFSYLASSGQHVVTDTLFMHGASVGVEWNF
ncbi:MAG: hypothetical protein FWC43_12665 [Planctomycetaceae bacterium]|nr:hypothetical protein [Planctomycetaceae bacterium]